LLSVVDDFRQTLETTPIVRPLVDRVDAPAVFNVPAAWPRDDPTSELTANPVVKSVEPQVDTDKLPHPTHKVPALETPAVIEKLSPSVSTTPELDHGEGIVIQEMEGNIFGFSEVGTAGGPGKPTQEPAFSHWLPALREIKHRIEQFTEGRLRRTSHLDQVRLLSRMRLTRRYLILNRVKHPTPFFFAAVLCASSCQAPPSPPPTLHLLSAT